MNRYFAAGIVIAAALLSTGVLAQSVNSYSPTEQEWLAWPDYCRARFVVSGAGRETQYALRVPSGVVARYEAQIGSTAWHWLTTAMSASFKILPPTVNSYSGRTKTVKT